MGMTVRMYRIDDGALADIHQAEVENMKAHGWAVSDAVEEAQKSAPVVTPDHGEPLPLNVAKGARGMFFVKSGGKAVSKGFQSIEDAQAELERMKAA